MVYGVGDAGVFSSHSPSAPAPSTCSGERSGGQPIWAQTSHWSRCRGSPVSCRKGWHCHPDPAAEWLLPEQDQQTGPGTVTTKESPRASEHLSEQSPCVPLV